MEFEKALLYVKTMFEQHPEHQKTYTYREKFGHTLRVYKWAQTLLETEKADSDVLLMAVIFHDVGYIVSPENHMRHSSDICREYLIKNNYSVEYISRVCEIIINHDEKELLHEEKTSIEQILMIEADNLDESGVLSVLRDALAAGADENVSYYAAFERICKHTVSEQKIERFSVTPAAKRLWEKKRDEYNMFISALKRDLQ